MEYDVAIIGGGPAGMMAAGSAGETGAKVILLEKNDRLGIKLLMTGNGRCNITNDLEGIRQMSDSFGKKGKFLLSALSRFGAKETVRFFEDRGLETKVEKRNQVFPVSDKASDVLKVLIGYLDKSKVEISLNSEVKELVKSGNHISKIRLTDGREIVSKKYILCTGGKSIPTTGSTGDGYGWLKKSGHKIIEPKPSLAPIILKDDVKAVEGASLSGVEIKLKDRLNKIIAKKRGDAIFTADGLSGPAIHELSMVITRLEEKGTKISLDFFPDHDLKALEKKMLADFQQFNNKKLKNYLEKNLPPKFVEFFGQRIFMDMGKPINSITKEERIKMIGYLKDFEFDFNGLKGFDKAMVTSGGVDLREIDPKTMKSKLIDNLFLAGEIIDLDGPTGGYNLQLCWSSGYAAGEAAAKLDNN